MNATRSACLWVTCLVGCIVVARGESSRPLLPEGLAGLDVVFSEAHTAETACVGDGSGLFACSDIPSGERFSWDLAAGFVDGDHYLDIVIANRETGGVHQNRVCLGDGAGGFACSDVSTDQSNTSTVALGFVDGDAALDAVFGNPGVMRVCLGDGAGAFTCDDMSTGGAGLSSVALGFVDGDQHLDAVFANSGRNRVCLGDGTGDFSCSDVSTDENTSAAVELRFVNADAHLDAVFANTLVAPPASMRNRLCLGDGMGGFACSDLSADEDRSRDVAMGFVDSDGNLDAVFANDGTRNRVCLGDGLGAFTCGDVSTDENDSLGVALGFVNSDAHVDAVFGNWFQPNRACLGNGTGAFACVDVSADAKLTTKVTLGEFSSLLFADGFESGDVSRWSTSVP